MIADQLRYFLAAARHEHLGRAAEELEMSQPALSRSILRLEEEYGVQLFDRVGRGVRLNAGGRILLKRVEHAFGELEDARKELSEYADAAVRSVSIGFLATFGIRVVPDLIRGFGVRREDLIFRLLQGPHPQLRERLLSGEIDLCISSPRFAEAGLQWRPLYEEELFIFVPPDHRLADRGAIDLIEIANEPVVAMKPAYGLRQLLDQLARDAGFSPHVAFEAEEVQTLYGLVGAGFGVAMAPSAGGAIEGLCVGLKVKNPSCRRTVGLSWRSGRFLSERATAFRQFILDQYPDAGAGPP